MRQAAENRDGKKNKGKMQARNKEVCRSWLDRKTAIGVEGLRAGSFTTPTAAISAARSPKEHLFPNFPTIGNVPCAAPGKRPFAAWRIRTLPGNPEGRRIIHEV